MKIDPRHYIFTDAKIEFSKFWISFLETHDITMFEFMSILSSEMQSMVNICIRTEREDVDEHSGPEFGRQKDGN